MDKAKIQIVPPIFVRKLSDEALGWLSDALQDDPRSTLGGLLEDICEMNAQLWVITIGERPHMVLVTRIIHYECADSLLIQLCGGRNLDQCIEVLPELEEYARHLGCQYVDVQGRKGWERILPEYTVRGIQLAKEI